MHTPDPEGYTTKITRLKKGVYGCRVFKNGKLHSEAVAKGKSEISSTIKELLRWVDKLDGDSSMASASRDRGK